MPIPKVNQGEPEEEFISRCMTAISDEYDNKQAYAICKNELDKANGISLTKWRRDFVYKNDLQNRVKDLFKNKTNN